MNDVFLGLIAGLSSNPAMLLLCVVLIGGGWMGKGILTRVIDGVFSRLDKFDSRLEGIEEALKEIVEIRKDVEHVEKRVERVEAACSRRHEKE